MCRALIYLGQPVLLDNLLFQPDSALVRQSYMPKMLDMLNLAGFGMRAWDQTSHDPDRPYAYASPNLPVFDRNLKHLAEKICPRAVLAHVRGVPYNITADISAQNVHPFQFPGACLALAHNGDLSGIEEMRPLLAPHLKPGYAARIRGTTDSEWIYALLLSQLSDESKAPNRDELLDAIQRTLSVLREVRRHLGIATCAALNLFITDGRQLAAVRYCYDFGCYPTEELLGLRSSHLNYLSLWYTLGRDYGLHDGEWKMVGGAGNAQSILVASEPLTQDLSGWVEVPEYAALHVEVGDGRPVITLRHLD